MNNNNDLISKILKIKEDFKISNATLNRFLKNRFNTLYLKIEEKTKNLNKFKKFDKIKNKFLDISIFERIYCLEHNLNDRPKCKHCQKQYVNGFDLQKNTYRNWCSPKCQASDPSCIKKSKSTKLQKYGNENFVNTKLAFETRFKKYGSFQNEDFVEKVKQTKLKHFGNENFNNVEKTKQTKFEKYGDENFNNVEKTKQTKFEKYGDENFNNREKFNKTISKFTNNKKTQINEKRLNTNFQKYKAAFPTQNSSIKEKIFETCLKKYGVKSCLMLEKFKQKAKISQRTLMYEKIILNNFSVLMTSKEDFLTIDNLHKDNCLKFKCKKCNEIYFGSWSNGPTLCDKCFPKINGTSNLEKEIVEFLSCFKKNLKTNTKSIISPLELDIYIPEKKLAIEFDGLYQHSDNNQPNKNYHLNKTELCEKQNIQLIHIFENEWVYKQDIVKSRLKNLLGVYDKTIYARQCEIREVSSKESKDFQDNNHIQGSVNSKINLGLFYNNELISLMTFGKCRFNKKYEYELLRFCNRLGYHIPGSASKLLKYFEKIYQPKSLISYADRRWSKGNVYEKLGFKLDHIANPNYWYFKQNSLNLESRIKYQKHKLKNILDNFDENKSEVENMKANGYNRIFDCGNLVYVKEF